MGKSKQLDQDSPTCCRAGNRCQLCDPARLVNFSCMHCDATPTTRQYLSKKSRKAVMSKSSVRDLKKIQVMEGYMKSLITSYRELKSNKKKGEGLVDVVEILIEYR